MKHFRILFTLFILFCLASSISAQNEIINWKFKTKGIVYSSPLVVDNVLYIGSKDGNLYAINKDTGEKIWSYLSGNEILSSPAFSDNIICFESGNKLYGVNTLGDSLWCVSISEGTVTNHYDDWDYFHSSPIIVDSVAYVGSERGQVIGVNITTGEEVLRIDTGNRGIGIRSRPVVYEGKIYFGECSGFFYCYDLSTKEKLWSYDTNPEKLYTDPAITANPVLHNGIIYFGGRHCLLYALNAETGEKSWSYSDPNGMWMLGGPTISDSLLFMGSSNQCMLHSFNIKTKKLLWRTSVDGRINGTPAIDGDYVFFGTGYEKDDKTGSIFVINKISGELVNLFKVGAQIHSSVKIVENDIFFGSRDSCIYSIDKTALINSLHPQTEFSQTQDYNIGEIYSDTCITISVKNTGSVPDSVTTSLFGLRLPAGAFSISPANFILPANDSAEITLNIITSPLAIKSYRFSVKITSHRALSNLPVTMSKTVTLTYGGITSVENNEQNYTYNLSQNYPNPFNPETKIEYSIKTSGNVTLSVFNTIGEKVAELINEYKPAGNYEVNFNAANLSSGIYFYRLESNNFSSIKKLVLLR